MTAAPCNDNAPAAARGGVVLLCHPPGQADVLFIFTEWDPRVMLSRSSARMVRYSLKSETV